MASRNRREAQAQNLMVLIKKTNTEKPQASDVAALRQALIEDDNTWRKAGDLTERARRMALAKLSPTMRESVMLRVEAMQADLGYEYGTMLERLLIEQVGTCWLHVEIAQMVYGVTTLGTTDAKTCEVLERRVMSAQKRYLKAMEMLVRVWRTLRRPVMLAPKGK